MEQHKECPFCGSTHTKCPECGRHYKHGTIANCQVEDCKEVNAPIDCSGCGRVVSDDLTGVLDFDMTLKKYAS